MKCFGLLTLLVVLSLLCCPFAVADTEGVRLTNGVWLDYRWVCDPDYGPGDVSRLLEDLEQKSIHRVYLNCGSLTAEGKFRGGYLRHFEFIRLAREWARQRGGSQISIEAWLNGNLDPARGESIDLSRPEVRSEIAAVCRGFIAGQENCPGFTGIHLDLEPASGGNSDFLKMFEELRSGGQPAVPENINLSLAGHSISANSKWTWSADYAAQVLELVDELALMGYDSGRLSGDAYAGWLGDQAEKLLEVAEKQPGKSILIGVPTYAFNEFCTAHYALAETLDHAITGIRSIDPFRYKAFAGLCIFPWGETDAGEWEVWRTRWLNQPPQPLAPAPLTRQYLQEQLSLIQAERKVIAHFRLQPTSRMMEGYSEMLAEEENAARREDFLTRVLAGLAEDANEKEIGQVLLEADIRQENELVNQLTRAEARLQSIPFWKFWARNAARSKVTAAARDLVLAQAGRRALQRQLEDLQASSGGTLEIELAMEDSGAILLPPGVDASDAHRQMERAWKQLGVELQKTVPDDAAVEACAAEYRYWKAVWEILEAAPGRGRQ